MHVAVISAEYPFGVSESFLEAELRVLATQFPEVSLFPTVVGNHSREAPAGIRVCAVPLFRARTFATAVAELVRRPRVAFGSLWRLLSSEKSAVVRLKDLAVFAKALCIAREVRRSDIRHIHAYWLASPASIAYIVSRLTGVTYSMSAHRWDIYAPLAQLTKARGAAFVRAISRRGAADLAEIVEPAAAQRIVVVYLGVSVPATPAPRTFEPPLRILVPAALIERKDHRTLLQALALLRERNIAFHCTMAGDGPLREDLKRRASALELANFVTFAGQVQHADLLASYAAGRVDVVVLTTREPAGGHGEGIPVSLMEAMAAGVPCIATPAGSIPELIADADDGILINQGSPDALAAALSTIALDAARARRLGDGGRSRVKEAFNVERNAIVLAGLFRQAAS